MPQRRPSRPPALCRIHSGKHEIVISAAGKRAALRLGGVKMTLPVRLLKVNSRLLEDTAELPASFGNDPSRRDAAESELFWLEDDQLAEAEDVFRQLYDPSETPFFSTPNN